MKICLLSDLDFRASGYFNISTALGTELSKRGHSVKAIGYGYTGEEHTFPFGIIPCRGMEEAFATIANLKNMWGFDAFVCAIDINFQDHFVQFNIQNGSPMKYIGIMPIEADPLCFSWALILSQMDKALIISEFGTEEARKAGINADYIPVGIDTQSWRPPKPEERESIRKSLGLAPEDFVVLTVAYNQERKFLSRSMEIFASFLYGKPVDEIITAVKRGDQMNPLFPAKYVMVTVEQSPVGWRLRDLAQELGINDRLSILERGMDFNHLWSIYAASDAFLLTSKAEGLGMPLLEAMAMGLPVAGTNCTGIKELLSDGRGVLIDYDYVIRDPFGNGNRYYASITSGVQALHTMYEYKVNGIVNESALAYVRERSWTHTADVLEKYLKEITNEQKTPQGEEVSVSTPGLISTASGHSNSEPGGA